ncbi:MAG: glycosyltransferase [Bacteroidota bacterium]
MNTRIAIICEDVSLLSHIDGKNATGSSVYIAELALFLSRNGFHIDIFNICENLESPGVVDWMPGIKVTQFNRKENVDIPGRQTVSQQQITCLAGEIISAIRQTGVNYSLIHAFSRVPAMIAMELENALEIPFVVTLDGITGNLNVSPEEEHREMEVMITKKAKQIIVTNIQEKEALVHLYNADQHKISIITGGYNPDEFKVVDKSLARTILGLREEENILLYIGQVKPSRGIDTIIQSLPLIETKQIKLIVIGGKSSIAENDKTEEIQRLKKLAIKLGVLPRILFTGSKNRNNLKYFYSAADIFVTTPLKGSFSLAPIEAMACGTPVISTDIGSITNAVANGKTGFIVPSGEPAMLAQKIDLLLSDKALMHTFQKHALKRAHALFPWEQVANMVKDLYLKMIQPKEKSTPVVPIKRSLKPHIIPGRSNGPSIAR